MDWITLMLFVLIAVVSQQWFSRRDNTTIEKAFNAEVVSNANFRREAGDAITALEQRLRIVEEHHAVD